MATEKLTAEVGITAKTDGVDKAAAQLNKLADASDNVEKATKKRTKTQKEANQESEKTVQTMERETAAAERNTRVRESLDKKLTATLRRVDKEFREQTNFQRDKSLLSRAVDEGYGADERTIRLIEVLAQKEQQLTAAINDNTRAVQDNALAKLTALKASISTESAANAAFNARFGIRDDFGADKRAADIEAYGAALDNLRAKLNPAFAAERQYTEALAEANNASRVGAINQNEYADAISRATAAYANQTASMRKAGTDVGPVRMSTAANDINRMHGLDTPRSTADRGADMEAALRAGDNLRAKYDPLFAIGKKYREQIEEIKHANAIGELSHEKMAAAILKAREATRLQVAELKGAKTATAEAAAEESVEKFGLARYELINLGRQAQDIAVSLAGGQSPLTVLAQQGSQVYDVLATSKGGVGSALKSLGETLMGLVTPGRVAMVGILGGLAGVEMAASRAQSALAALGRSSKETGFAPTSIMGAQVIGARAGLDGKAVEGTLSNASGQFEAYKKNAGEVLEFIKSVDKGFLKVLDTSRNVGEWIDKIGQEIRKLPLAEARDLSEKAFGAEAARALFDTIREGKFNMEAFTAAAGSAAAPIDDAARRAEDMQNQINAAATKAGNDLLVAFQSLGSPVENIKIGWYETVSYISKAITESQNLQTAFWALLHPLDAVSLAITKLNAGLADKISEILGETKKTAADVQRGSLFIEMSGGAPRNPRAQGRSISQIESDLKLNKLNTPDMVPEPEFNRARNMMLLGGDFRVGGPVGSPRARYEARKEAESGARKSGKTDGEKEQEAYEKILKDLEQQIRLVEAVGDARKNVQWQIEKENWLEKLGNVARDDHKKKIEETAEALRKVRDEQEKINEKVAQFNEAYSSAAGIVSGGVKDILRGGKPGDVLRKGLDAFGDNVLDAALTGSGPLAKMFGMDNKTGGVGGLFGSVASMFGLGGKDVQTQTMKVNAANVEVVGAAGMLDGAKGLFSGIGDSAGGFLSGIGNFFSSLFPFADGGVMTSAGPIPLRRYASGGVASSPQLAMFGEGHGPEAFVPLPDGRSIPVSMKGGGEPKINIHNYAGVQVEARKNTAGEIEVLIDRKIAANNARLPSMLSDYDRRRA